MRLVQCEQRWMRRLNNAPPGRLRSQVVFPPLDGQLFHALVTSIQAQAQLTLPYFGSALVHNSPPRNASKSRNYPASPSPEDSSHFKFDIECARGIAWLALAFLTLHFDMGTL